MLLCQNEAIRPNMELLLALDDEKRLGLDAWTVMKKSVLRSLVNYHTVKTH